MINKESYLKILFEKQEWTSEEKVWLLGFLENSDASEAEMLMKKLFEENLEKGNLIDAAVSRRMLSRIKQKAGITEKKQKTKLVFIIKMAAAACVSGMLGLATFFILKKDSEKPTAQTQVNSGKYNYDVTPGGKKAVLTLADGSTLILDDVQNGTLAHQGNTRIIKLNGKLNYNASGKEKNEVLYNTITTPVGGQYQVELSDGTKLWLNAASSLHFPTAFTGKERKVTITGEVYFEVKKNKAMPFIVSANGAAIQVLGTHFNVMAYSDEEILKTTLLEGSVKFIKDKNSTMLKPGQQSQLFAGGEIKVENNVNVAKVMAWKNDYFDFEGSDFSAVARQLARWYDIEIMYDRKIDDLFYAEIPRNMMLSDVLKALELTGKLRFKILGKKVHVLPLKM